MFLYMEGCCLASTATFGRHIRWNESDIFLHWGPCTNAGFGILHMPMCCHWCASRPVLTAHGVFTLAPLLASSTVKLQNFFMSGGCLACTSIFRLSLTRFFVSYFISSWNDKQCELPLCMKDNFNYCMANTVQTFSIYEEAGCLASTSGFAWYALKRKEHRIYLPVQMRLSLSRVVCLLDFLAS